MNYQMIEYAVRRYIDEKKLFDGRKDYHLSIKNWRVYSRKLLCIRCN